MTSEDAEALRSAFATIVRRTAPLGLRATLDVGGAEADGADAAGALAVPIARGAMRLGTIRFHGDSVGRVGELLRDMTADLWAAHESRRTIDQFATRLGQAYEQSHLMFRLARVPERPRDRDAWLEDAVDRLREVAEFGWILLRFADAPQVAAALRGRRFSAGGLPIDDAAVDALIGRTPALLGGGPLVVSPGDGSPLGPEVVLAPLVDDGRLLGLILAGGRTGPEAAMSSFETQLLAACAGSLTASHGDLARREQQEAMFLGTLRALSAAIDAKDRYTRGHSERVGLLARGVALQLGLGEAVAERHRVAGLIHDVGKIGVPEAVLCKPGRLAEDEFALIKRHPEIGHDIVRDVPGLEDVLPGVLHHHEAFDGRGYPHGLIGEAIPLVARVLAICDTFDAMSSNRAYRTKMPREQVLAELRKCAGRQFDPAVVEAFFKMDLAEFDAALLAHADRDQAAVATPAPLPAAA